MPRLAISKRERLRSAVELQRLAFAAAEILDKDLKASSDPLERSRLATAIGSLITNWTKLGESIRTLRGEPLPGALRPRAKTVTGKRGGAAADLIPLPVVQTAQAAS